MCDCQLTPKGYSAASFRSVRFRPILPFFEKPLSFGPDSWGIGNTKGSEISPILQKLDTSISGLT